MQSICVVTRRVVIFMNISVQTRGIVGVSIPCVLHTGSVPNDYVGVYNIGQQDSPHDRCCYIVGSV